MKVTIDTDAATVTTDDGGTSATHPLASPEGFALASRAWLRAGWDVKHVYTFTWFDRPIIQHPEDLVRVQELLFSLQPDVILETGIAHGGSLVLSASVCKLLGKGRVIGVDVEIRPHNRVAIEAHPLAPWITMIEGSSIDPDIVTEVKTLIRPGEKVVLLLDSNHTKAHVLAELRAYAPLVAVGSYVVAMDGAMADFAGGPRTHPDWGWNNPCEAAKDYVAENPDFVIAPPPFRFNESLIAERITYYKGGWLRRIR